MQKSASGRAASTRHHVQIAGREAGLGQNFAQNRGTQRRVGGRLEDDRIPGGDGRQHLVSHGIERGIERRNRANHANRFAHGERYPAFILPGRRSDGNHFAGQPLRFLRGCGEGLQTAVEFGPAIAECEPRFSHHQVKNLFFAFRNQLTAPAQDLVAPVGMDRSCLERRFRRRHGFMRQVLIGVSHHSDHGIVKLVQYFGRAAGFYPIVVDER